MCGKFTQLASWEEVHAFSQALIIKRGAAELIGSTPMRTARIMRLDAEGRRELVTMRWGFAGMDDRNPSRPKRMHARGDDLPPFFGPPVT